jgi:predicted DsbA family dithiol-disulfide isomerase
VAAAGADPAAVRAEAGELGAAAVAEARVAATEAGVAGTPALLFDTGLLVPGVQPRDALRRWVARTRAAAS